MRFSIILLSFFFVNQSIAQLIWADPVFPLDSEPVIIFFDATQGTGGLANCNCDVYLHTGVITDQSTNPSDWKHVVTSWGVANDDWKMTPVSGQDNVYSYDFMPDIRNYYGVPMNEIIEQMAFVFRNANGSLERDDARALTNDNASPITIRQIVYIKSDGDVDLARANALSTAERKLGVVEATSIAAAASGSIFTRKGTIIGGFSGLTPGADQFLSVATAGLITETAPSTSGQIIRKVGEAISATEIEFNPEDAIEIV